MLDNKLSILYEDDYIIAVNKPPSLIVEQNIYEDSLENWVVDYLRTRKRVPFVGIIHRLDRVTSGIILFAKKKQALKVFNDLFATKKIAKTYHALVEVEPNPTKGVLHNYLLASKIDKKTYNVPKETRKSQEAILEYSSLEKFNELFLLEIKPQTGRFHQIRAQLAFNAMPIIGDSKYGSNTIFEANSIGLHAFSLAFEHPFLENETPLFIEAPYPNSKHWLK